MNLLRLNELDITFATTRLQQDAEQIWALLPHDSREVKQRFESLLSFQRLVGYMEGLEAIQRARDTTERWKRHPDAPEEDNPARKVLLQVKKRPTMDEFLAKHGDEKIPASIKDWAWLKELRGRIPEPTWNDAARRTAPKTRKAFQVQLRRLREHVAERDSAQDFLNYVVSLTQRRKSKEGVRSKAAQRP